MQILINFYLHKTTYFLNKIICNIFLYFLLHTQRCADKCKKCITSSKKCLPSLVVHSSQILLLHFWAYMNSSTPYKRDENPASYITRNAANLTLNNFSHYLLNFKGTCDLFKKVKLNAFMEDINICVK